MDAQREIEGMKALRAYVAGDTSEPVILSAFRQIPFEERGDLLSRHRGELEAIDGGRLVIVESMLLPWDARSR